jgi:hypothetical protein
MANVEEILSLIDSIALLSTDDVDVLDRVTTMRTSLNGIAPSIILRQAILRDPDDQERIEALQHENDGLRVRIAEMAAMVNVPKPNAKGMYSLEAFLAALQLKRGQTYAWRVDYCVATNNTPNCNVAKNEDVQKWQRTGEVPAWAYEQMAILVFPKRGGKGGPPWTDAEYTYLKNLYLADPSKSNLMFADACTLHFGRPITENAIKGALDRLRKRKEIPGKRPKKG